MCVSKRQWNLLAEQFFFCFVCWWFYTIHRKVVRSEICLSKIHINVSSLMFNWHRCTICVAIVKDYNFTHSIHIQGLHIKETKPSPSITATFKVSVSPCPFLQFFFFLFWICSADINRYISAIIIMLLDIQKWKTGFGFCILLSSLYCGRSIVLFYYCFLCFIIFLTFDISRGCTRIVHIFTLKYVSQYYASLIL